LRELSTDHWPKEGDSRAGLFSGGGEHVSEKTSFLSKEEETDSFWRRVLNAIEKWTGGEEESDVSSVPSGEARLSLCRREAAPVFLQSLQKRSFAEARLKKSLPARRVAEKGEKM